MKKVQKSIEKVYHKYKKVTKYYFFLLFSKKKYILTLYQIKCIKKNFKFFYKKIRTEIK